MLKSNRRVVVITMGDPKGIGPEVISKSLAQKSLLKEGHFIVIGDKKILGRIHSSVEVVDVPYRSAGEGSLKFLDKAIALIKEGGADALVTAPLSKEAVSRYHKNFTGHTEYLAEAFNVRKFDMMFIVPDVRLTIVTRHVPLKDVPKLITQKAVLNSISLMAKTLKDRFKIRNPKIAVLGLNPHAGEGGLLGSEDVKNILPAIRKARAQGINAHGPLPADTFFAFNVCHSSSSICHSSSSICHSRSSICHSRESGNPYDGIIAMYHDQGLAPLKGLYMKELVNFTAGLPFVRTSPAHGTAYDIAGKNKADPSSMLSAIKLALELAQK
jgi:4-hydroxythreonine-4-phosphate dehydrogenase